MALKAAILTALIWTCSAHATDVDEDFYFPVPLAKMALGSIYYSARKPFLYSDWKPGPDKRILNLFPSFRGDDAYKQSEKRIEPEAIVMYLAKARLVLDKPAASIDFKPFLRPEIVAKMLDGFADANGDMTRWRNHGIETYRQNFLSYRNPPDSKWCESPTSLCIESHYILDSSASFFLGLVSWYKKITDPEIYSQSEIRVGVPTDASTLADMKINTDVGTTPTGMITQNVFWFSHVAEFAKVVGIVQPFSKDEKKDEKRKTVVTAFVLFAVEAKWWYFLKGTPANLEQVFMGTGHNSTSGLTMGLPKVTQHVFKSMAEILSSPNIRQSER